ncbi:MAG TPA: hypothetical protein VM582_05295 [Candidatus Thermoplasmatota archaeon]|nr:hypothetical protein [Candidatus Thermoplasmatota archaeon]
MIEEPLAALRQALVATALLLLALAVFFARPRRLQGAVLALALAAEAAVWWLSVLSHGAPGSVEERAAGATMRVAIVVLLAAYLAFLGTLPTRISRGLGTPRAQMALALLALAACLLLLARAQARSALRPMLGEPWLLSESGLWSLVDAATVLVFLYGLVVAALLARSTARGTPARTRAWLYLAAFALRDAAIGGETGANLLVPGLVPREVSVVTNAVGAVGFAALLGYAILRHRLFDLDLRIKWTLRSGTVAGAYVALFFVASESAAAALGERWGTYVGILAAGLLVFAFAPLQRLAQRVSDVIMPGVADTAVYQDRRKEEVYRAAVEETLADGSVTLKERKVLLRLQEELGLDPASAHRLEAEVVRGMEGR